MKRHSTYMPALLFGLAFGVVGAAFLVNETTGSEADPAWVSAIGFMVLGSIALAATLLRRPHGHDHDLALEAEPRIDES